MSCSKANYGIDAPYVVYSLFILSFFTLILLALSFSIKSSFWFWITCIYLSLMTLSLFLTGCWMLYSSLILKPKIVRMMIEQLKLKGNETVLDMGCGRGLVLIEAAKQLSSGKACGIDLWMTRDQSGNALQTTLDNVKKEGVANQIEVKTGDMQAIPYQDCSFDAIISSLAIHNIPNQESRCEALSEMLRVLKPGGHFALLDICYGHQYVDFLGQQKVKLEQLQKVFHYCPTVQFIKGIKLN